MDLARYVSLLERGVFFARADTFTDVWEGGFGAADLERFRTDNAHLGVPEFQAAWDDLVAKKDAARSSFGVSCWHKAAHESAALWELYIPRGLGVAVRSTAEIAFVLAYPAAQRLGGAAELLRHRSNRLPLRAVLSRVLVHHPDGTFFHLR
jgi:hypothetical protein